MTRRAVGTALLLPLSLIAASGCAPPIAAKWLQQAAPGATVPNVAVAPDLYVGATVVWGGIILDDTRLPKGSELVILDTPLDPHLWPEDAKFARGRFIASTSDFLDPLAFRPEQKVTVAGEVTGQREWTQGASRYTCPVVLISQIYLWPHQERPGPAGGWPWMSRSPSRSPFGNLDLYDSPGNLGGAERP